LEIRLRLVSTPSKEAVDFKIVELTEGESISCSIYFILRGVLGRQFLIIYPSEISENKMGKKLFI